MLHLLQTPRWLVPGAQHDLPATLPGWIVAFLALQGDWVSRDRLLVLFWPDAGSAEAHNSLRANLHRARQLLGAWGIADQLLAERRRVRLTVPSDVANLRAALAAGNDEEIRALYVRPLLDGMAFAGFAAFQEWVELERAALQVRWREALLGQLAAATPPRALDLARRLLAADALDERAVAQQITALSTLGLGREAALAYAAYCQRLQHDLGAEPSSTLRAVAQRLGLLDGPPTTSPANRPCAPRDAFIGRDVELAQLQAVFRQPGVQIVTLVGPGGVGKSRLARELCTRLAAQFADGVHWVALSNVVDADDAFARLAAVLGLVPAAGSDVSRQVAGVLTGRTRLLVLDNGEQVAGLGDQLAKLAAAAPDMRCLVTSRTPLKVAQERRFALDGLACPPDDGSVASLAEARGFGALRLLEARAQSLDADFDLATQLDACAALVRRMGGWPLAIEIAATLLAAQSAAEVLADLAQTLDTLAAATVPRQARHDNVRASLALSWQLLNPAQQHALACLSVFKDGFTRVSALAVTQAEGPVLAALIERLLVHATGGGRSTLHPLVAQFAAERLAVDALAEHDAQGRHAEHFVQRLRTFADRSQADALAVANCIEADFDNFRAAWHWVVLHQGALALGPSARAWTHFCNAKGRARDVAALVEPAIADARSDGIVRASLLLALANARYRGGDLDPAIALAREAGAAADAAGEGVGGRSALNLLALALLQRGLGEEAGRHAHEALRRARTAGSDEEIASIANTCAIVANVRGDLAAAAVLYEEAMAIHRRRGNLRGLALCLNNLGNVWRAHENLPEAQRCFEECLRLCEQHGIAATRAFALGNLGLVAFHTGRHDAARLYAERTLAEPALEPAMALAALALHARVAVEQGRLEDGAEFLRRLTQQARAIGLHGALMAAIICHARLLMVNGERNAAAARLHFVVAHAHATAADRSDARRMCEALDLNNDERAQADQSAQGLDLDVLLERAAHANAGASPDA